MSTQSTRKMMARKRYSAAFSGKVTRKALKDTKTINQIAIAIGRPVTHINTWQK